MKKILSILCATAMCATSIVPVYAKSASSPNAAFDTFLQEDFKETMEDDYTTMHSYLSNPEQYGIQASDVKVTLGSISYTKEDKKELNATIKKLKKFKRSSLNQTQQEIYDEYVASNTLAKKQMQEKYRYLPNIWSSSNGIQSVLANYFANFDMYSEDDVKAFIKLLKDTDRYTDDAIAFSKKQAQQGTLCFDYNDVMETINTTIKNKDQNEIYNNASQEIDALQLSETKTNKYKEQVQKALDTDYFPAYQTMKTELKKLKSKNNKATPITKQKNGLAYYKLLVEQNAGTTKSPNAILYDLANGCDDMITQMQSYDSSSTEAKTNFSSANEIMEFLKTKYTQDYPEIQMPNYEIQDLPEEQTSDNVVAYYVEPPFDSNDTNRIRFNAVDYGGDVTSLDTYMTFAHEGIPGHMYQANYNHQHLTYPIQHCFSEIAFTEGFAMLAEEQALGYLDDQLVSSDAKDMQIINDKFSYYLPATFDLMIHLRKLSKSEFVDQMKDMYDEDTLKDMYDSFCYEPCMYLPYAYGWYQLDSLRDKVKKALGDSYDNIEFIDTLLKYGVINFDIIRKNVNTYIAQKTGTES